MSELATVIDATEERFKAVAPSWMKYESEKGFAIQIFNNNEYLGAIARSSPHSVQQALTNVAAIGLSLNPAKKQAYLISRTVKVKGQDGRDKYQSRIFLEPSYIGLCDIITGSGMIEWIQAECVFSNDKFKMRGISKEPDHDYEAFASKEKRGKFIGAYCVAKTTSGDFLTELMSKEDIISVRNRSEAWKSKMQKEAQGKKGYGGPWETDFYEMAKKTVVRRAFKMLPKNKDLQRAEEAIHLSNGNEGFDPIVSSPNIQEFTGETKNHFDRLIEKNDALEMYVLSMSIGEGAFTGLYHSFEKGAKGKYQRIVDVLIKRGQSLFSDLLDMHCNLFD